MIQKVDNELSLTAGLKSAVVNPIMNPEVLATLQELGFAILSPRIYDKSAHPIKFTMNKPEIKVVLHK